MRLRWYPAYLAEGPGTSVQEILFKELAKRPDLRRRVEDFLHQVEEQESLDDYYATKEAFPVGDGVEEFRIPKQAKGGVVRIYFCTSLSEPKTLYLLDAELKKGDPRRIERAKARLTRYREDEKRKMK